MDLWSNSWTDADQTSTICTPLLTGYYAGMLEGHPRSSPPPLPSSSSAWTWRMLIGQSTDQTMHVLEGVATPCRWLAIYPGLSDDHPWDNFRCSALFCKQHTREMSICAQYCPISGQCDVARSTNLRSILRYRVIDMNHSFTGIHDVVYAQWPHSPTLRMLNEVRKFELWFINLIWGICYLICDCSQWYVFDKRNCLHNCLPVWTIT